MPSTDRPVFNINDIRAIKISLASPEKIRSWSFGEVRKPETMNYRTMKPEKEGLFCARIFGPIKDWECLCGKYKGNRYRGVVCEKCGVEVSLSHVRRERMGHIELAYPCVHIWFLKTNPSKIGYLLDMSQKDIERVIYFESYVITEVSEKAKSIKVDIERLKKGFKKMKSLFRGDELEKRFAGHLKQIESFSSGFRERSLIYDDIVEVLKLTYGKSFVIKYEEWIKKPEANRKKLLETESFIVIGIGAECIKEMLRKVGLEIARGDFIKRLREDIKKVRSETERVKIAKRIRIAKAFKDSGNNPEWMVLDVLPVLPPDLRPLVTLDTEKLATSDINELYRRVIQRNNRLRRLMDELGAPDIIIWNERRMLQEAVDALLDNSKRSDPMKGHHRRPLRSLSDIIKGKHGRFRQNLLGKRVDFSARSVIVVGPDLKLHQAGIPKEIAVELFKQFLIWKLSQKDGQAQMTVAEARKLVEARDEKVFELLEDVVKEKLVLLNRAPTLHRASVQAFEPVIKEGKAITLHPLICTPYNADFDGDQMGVFLPLSVQAQAEARVLMLSTHNILSPASGEPLMYATQDAVMGLFSATSSEIYSTNIFGRTAFSSEVKTRRFSSTREVKFAYEDGEVRIGDRIICSVQGRKYNTTVGRVLIWEELSDIIGGELPFDRFNRPLTKEAIRDIIKESMLVLKEKRTVILMDRLKNMGFEFATKLGITFDSGFLPIPKRKRDIVNSAESKIDEIEAEYNNYVITERERLNKTIEVWDGVKKDVRKELEDEMLWKDYFVSNETSNDRFINFDSRNPISNMAYSGARGSISQIEQLAGMRGLFAKPSGEIISYPVISSLKEGHTPLEYFVSTHGGRKGLADTALKTSKAGHLTRRLVDVAQEVVVLEEDCGTIDGIEIYPIPDPEDPLKDILPLYKRIFGRVCFETIPDPYELAKIMRERNTELELQDCVIVRKDEDINFEKAGKVELLMKRLRRDGDLFKRVLKSVENLGVKNIKDVWKVEPKKLAGEFEELRDLLRFEKVEDAYKFVQNFLSLFEQTDNISNISEVFDKIDRWSQERVRVYSVLTCRTKRGVCQKCYGWDLSRWKKVELGEAVGVIAAQSIGEPGTQLTMRTFHLGGVASAEGKTSKIIAPSDGKIEYNFRISEFKERDQDKDKTFIVMTREGRINIAGAKYEVPYGAKIYFRSGSNVRKGETVAEWDPYVSPILTHVSGKVSFKDLREGVTYVEKVGEKSTKIKKVTEPPVVKTSESRGGSMTYHLPAGAVIVVEDGQEVQEGERIAYVPKGIMKTRDITGGLPVVEEFFEARKLKNPARIARVSGTVYITEEEREQEKTDEKKEKGEKRIQRKKIKVTIEPFIKDEKVKRKTVVDEHYIKRGEHIIVRHGETVKAGEPITDGTPDPREILAVTGEVKSAAGFIVGELQKIYRFQGVEINDKNFEIIVRQMFRKVKIKDPGDSEFLPREEVDKYTLEAENEKLKKEKKKPATFEPVILGITRASLRSESFVAAASFQETTKILADAAIAGRVDPLYGIKENVIVGKLISVGTNFQNYRDVSLRLKRKEITDELVDSELRSAES